MAIYWKINKCDIVLMRVSFMKKPGSADHRAWGLGSGVLLRRVGTGLNKSHI